MLLLRRTKGWTPYSIHRRMRRSSNKKQNQFPHVSLRSCPYPFRAPHPLPHHINARRPLSPGAPSDHKSGGPLPPPRRDPWSRSEIHGGGAAMLQGSGRLNSIAAAMALLTPHPPPLPPSQGSIGGGGARVLPLIAGSDPASWNRPAQASLPYVANVCFRCFIVSKVCCNWFIWMLQK
jgi:hypothetical protein